MVQASTLGALEALLQFLREDTDPPIPVSAIGIGTIHKRDVTKISIMNEKGHPEFATILAFDVGIEKEAREHANNNLGSGLSMDMGAADMKNILGYLNQSEWMYSLNIGNIMQISPLTL